MAEQDKKIYRPQRIIRRKFCLYSKCMEGNVGKQKNRGKQEGDNVYFFMQLDLFLFYAVERN